MKYLSLLFCCIFFNSISAQEVPKLNNQSQPIPVEILFGNTRMAFQTSVNKPFVEGSKWGYSLIASLTSDYNITKATKTGMMVPVSITYKIFNSIALNGGLALNPAFGKRALLGLVFVQHIKGIMLVVVPTMYFSNSQFFETYASVEYQPKINDKLNLYTQLRGLYNFNIQNNDHDRSYCDTRLGLGYKNMTFGIGYNWDSYGPLKINVNNVGVFAKTVLF